MPTGVYKRTKNIRQSLSKHHADFSGKKHPFFGKHHSISSKLKMSESRKGKETSKETKIKMSKAQKGKKLSLEHKMKLKESHLGKNNYMFGKHFSKEAKRRSSLSHKGQNTWMKGRKLSEETKLKIKIARKNQIRRPVTKQTLLKMRKSHLGQISWNKRKHLSEETKLKIKKARAKQIFPVKDTQIEIKIQNFLKKLRIEFFTHQYMQIEHGYQCDILIPIQKGIINKIIIECDGDFIHCNPDKYSPDFRRFPNTKGDEPASVIWEKDRIRTKELIEKGFKVLRLWEFKIKAMKINEFKKIINGDKNEIY